MSQNSHETDRFEHLRQRMVEEQIANPVDGRPAVTDPNVLAAMRRTQRHHFVEEGYVELAYADRPLPIGHGQTISQPYIVAFMSESLKVAEDHTVLEIGTGSGYQAAVLAGLARHVYSIEIVDALAEQASRKLADLGYQNVTVKSGDGYQGWPEHAPFDGIMVTAAPDHVPQPLIDQLKIGGRLVLPVGPAWSVQKLTVLTKNEDGSVERQEVMPVGFVPLTRDN